MQYLTEYIVQVGLKLLARLPQTPKCWDFRPALPCPAEPLYFEKGETVRWSSWCEHTKLAAALSVSDLMKRLAAAVSML
jgi:hypothetical protein